MKGEEQSSSSAISSDNETAPCIKSANPIFNLHNVGNKHFRNEKCRSYSEQFIREIARIECANCDNQSFDIGKPPMIAFCGHFIHEGCDKRDNHYYCKMCKRDVEEADENKPLLDAVLSNFFKARRDRGFQCKGDAHRTHAYINGVNFPECEDKEFYCVWCVANNKEKKNKFQNYSASVMTHHAEEAQYLNTLDRVANVSGWALDACCLCMGVLRNKEDTDIVHLSCDHVGHKTCTQKENKCKLCDKEWDKTRGKVRKWHGKHYLSAYTPETYKPCDVCKQFHPKSNLSSTSLATAFMNLIKPDNSVRCVWCTVEKFGEKKK